MDDAVLVQEFQGQTNLGSIKPRTWVIVNIRAISGLNIDKALYQIVDSNYLSLP